MSCNTSNGTCDLLRADLVDFQAVSASCTENAGCSFAQSLR